MELALLITTVSTGVSASPCASVALASVVFASFWWCC